MKYIVRCSFKYKGNEKADRLSGKASIEDDLRTDKEEIVRAALDRLHIEDDISLGHNTHTHQEDC